ncbi:Secreted RxLR effector peptide protein [Phytophthora palmivora]|uniref:Secreted RxLR effector peptide protein n=1 Tax=Phytophthora palmivora TaxID=4796 RepID=A0A2P4XFZ3_9STRA|nr:Secreted RxLR effector peptide protein [Phytophthora palmivora]
MHFHCFVVLVLILAVNGGTHLVKADHTACSTSKTGAFLPRLLRAYHVSSANGAGSASRRNEERVTIPEASKTTKVFYKLLLKLDTPPKNLFNRLRLEDPGIKLGDNPVFLQWLQYVIKFQAKKGEDAFSNGQLYDLLQNIKTESELVNFFHSLRRKPNMKNLADTMQRYMVLDSASSHKVMNNAWFNSRETPMEVWNILRLSDQQ